MPAQVPYTAEFGKLLSELRRDKSDPFRQSRHYLAVGDLRPFGYEAILHAHCVHGDGNHKLELIDTGASKYIEMREEIERIFDVNAGALDIMRVDLAADITGIPVRWFLEHARAKWKRWAADIGKLEYSQMGMATVQTIYFGKRPNCYRIYDKLAEFQAQYSRLKRGNQEPVASFEELFGYPETGDAVLTRVERQIAAGRVPEQIGTIAKLVQLKEFNPFDRLELIAGSTIPPSPDNYDAATYLQGRGLRQLVEELGGIHRARRWLNKRSDGNAARVLKKLREFLPTSDYTLSTEQILRTFQDSVKEQFLGV